MATRDKIKITDDRDPRNLLDAEYENLRKSNRADTPDDMDAVKKERASQLQTFKKQTHGDPGQ